MNTPVIDPSTLSEEQRERLLIFYWDAETDSEAHNELSQTVGYARKTLLEALFGKEFFTNQKENSNE